MAVGSLLVTLVSALLLPLTAEPVQAQTAGVASIGRPAVTAPGVEETLLATRFLDAAPADRRWVARRGHPLNEDAHAHAGGFIYAAAGRSVLVVEDTQGIVMQPGQAAWAPEGIGHLHSAPARASNDPRDADQSDREVWTLLLERENDVRRPGAFLLTPPLIGLVPGPYEARLTAETFQAGAVAGPRRRTGPELVYLLDGAWELVYDGVPLTLTGGAGYLVDPGVRHHLRNAGPGPGHLLAALLVPFGGPADAPEPAS